MESRSPPDRSAETEPLAREEFPLLDSFGLSDRFDPFLPKFAREALDSGGRVRAVRSPGGIAAVLLVDAEEHVASVFTRSPALAERLFGELPEAAVYSEHPLRAPREVFGIFGTSLEPPPPVHSFRHAVRSAAPPDAESVRELLREVYGTVNDRWLRHASFEAEPCFVVEVGDRIAGAAWVSVAGGLARFHSLTVRPGYRRLGVGADLLFARLLWAREAGLREAFSEISERNPVSRYLAESGGMLRVGEISLYSRVAPPTARDGSATSGPLHRTGTSRPSSR